jgi:hypothetical protein
LLHSAKGRFLSEIHDVVEIAAFVASTVAAAWGGVAWLRSDPSTAFWPILRVAQVLVVANAALVGLLLLQGGDGAPDGLHIFYGVFPVVVNVFAEGLRVNAAAMELAEVEDVENLSRRDQVLVARRVVLREIGIMTIGTLMTVTLLSRAVGLI